MARLLFTAEKSWMFKRDVIVNIFAASVLSLKYYGRRPIVSPRPSQFRGFALKAVEPMGKIGNVIAFKFLLDPIHSNTISPFLPSNIFRTSNHISFFFFARSSIYFSITIDRVTDFQI